MNNQKVRLALKAAHMYYNENKTQHDIAHALGVSRSTVSRLLTWARKTGLVKILIAPLLNEKLAQLLQKKYGKQFVVVDVHRDFGDETRKIIGSTAAMFFNEYVKNGMHVGLSWGRTIAQMVEHVPPASKKGVTIVQLLGCIGNPQCDAHTPSIILQLARRVHASAMLLPAPAVVTDTKTKEALLSENSVTKILDLYNSIDIAFVGIGVLDKDSIIIQEKLLTHREVETLTKYGAVGDIVLRFFDKNGVPINTEISERIIGISIAQLRKIPTVVGVAGGTNKVRAIHAALQGDLVNVLITDAFTAKLLLEEGGESSGA